MQGQVTMLNFHLGVVYLNIFFYDTINLVTRRRKYVVFCFVMFYSMLVATRLSISQFEGSRKEFICVFPPNRIIKVRTYLFSSPTCIFVFLCFVFTYSLFRLQLQGLVLSLPRIIILFFVDLLMKMLIIIPLGISLPFGCNYRDAILKRSMCV